MGELQNDVCVVSSLEMEEIMREYIIQFNERDTLPDRLDEISSKNGISPEEQIRRYIAEGIGSSGLKSVPEEDRQKMTHIDEFLVASGALKPKPKT